jgi:GntR family transcriptional repressor for pyruvate dehydrogenase complex
MATSDFSPSAPNLSRGGAADQIVADIRDQILQGKLPRGSRLPNERDLAEHYGVSGPTIREAVRGLASINLVEARHGAGTYVTAAVDRMFMAAGSALIEFEGVSLVDILDMLETLYVKAATLACTQASDEELSRIAAHLDTLEAKGPGSDFSTHLTQFLTALAEASHNVLITALCKLLIGLRIELARERNENIGEKSDELNADRRALVEALLARDVDAAALMAARYHNRARELASAQAADEHHDDVKRVSRRMRRSLPT